MRQIQLGTSRRRLSFVAVALAFLVLIGVMVGVHSAQATSATPPPPGPLRVVGAPAQHGPLGMPAIQPRADLALAAGAHYTAADVRQYVETHRPGFAIPGTLNPAVISIQFLTAKQVSEQLQGEAMGVPDSTLLCLVRVSGSFKNTMAPLGATPKPFSQGVMVFDAQAGNLLISSVG